jgi:hypothetical protein
MTSAIQKLNISKFYQQNYITVDQQVLRENLNQPFFISLHQSDNFIFLK